MKKTDYKDTKGALTEEDQRARVSVVVIIIVSLGIRTLLAAMVGLGYDEAYYWAYSAHPALAYYDHPGLIGWLIWVTTLGGMWTSEFAIRLPALILGTLNIWLMYRLGGLVGKPRTGVIAAGLFAASGYGAIISGTFVLPDTPLVTCWIATLLLAVRVFGVDADSTAFRDKHTNRDKTREHSSTDSLLIVGCCMLCGLAMASKYQGLMLAIGLATAALLMRRSLFLNPWLYVGIVVAALVNLPTVIWHVSNDFLAFTHGSGMSMQGRSLSVQSLQFSSTTLLREIMGQVLYQNPIVWVHVAIAIWQLATRRFTITPAVRFLVIVSLPILVLFTGLSAFRETLPHWSAPGYLGLFVVTAVVATNWQPHRRTFIPRAVYLACALCITVILLAVSAIRFGILDRFQSTNRPIEELGRTDFTLSMYGWDQVASAFQQVRERVVQADRSLSNAPIVSTRWFTLALQELYIAKPSATPVIGLGPISSINGYAFWDTGKLSPGSNAWHVTTSFTYVNPTDLLQWFEHVETLDTFAIQRNGRTIEYGFVSVARGFKP